MDKQTKINLIEAVKNPPPERLAKIEYRSHLLQSFGIAFVCILLIMKGFWYIIFAFMFGIGISYSQGMSAFQKYKTIMSLRDPENLEDYDRDVSPSRRRGKIITSVMGKWAGWGSIVASVVTTVLIVNPTLSRWILMLLYPILFVTFYILYYFFVCYWIANPKYKKRINKK